MKRSIAFVPVTSGPGRVSRVTVIDNKLVVEAGPGQARERQFGLRPEALDNRARFGEASDRAGEVVEGQTVCRVLAPGGRRAWPGAHADAEVEPPAGHDVDSRGDLGQHRGRPEAVAGHEQPKSQPFGLCREGGQRRPALKGGPVRVAAYRQEVVEQPRMLDLRDAVRLAPDPQDVVVGDLRWGRSMMPKLGPRAGARGLVTSSRFFRACRWSRPRPHGQQATHRHPRPARYAGTPG